MDRRTLLKVAALLGLGGATRSAARAPSGGGKPIVLYCDLAVDPAREQEMLDHFHKTFKPAAETYRGRGFIDLKMLKIRSVIQGRPAPADGINYRFQLTYESEAQRLVWATSALHSRVWPLIEDTVLNKDYLVLLTDSA